MVAPARYAWLDTADAPCDNYVVRPADAQERQHLRRVCKPLFYFFQVKIFNAVEYKQKCPTGNNTYGVVRLVSYVHCFVDHILRHE